MTRLEPGTVLDGIDRDGAARLIVGTPGSGKTEFALSVFEWRGCAATVARRR